MDERARSTRPIAVQGRVLACHAPLVLVFYLYSVGAVYDSRALLRFLADNFFHNFRINLQTRVS